MIREGHRGTWERAGILVSTSGRGVPTLRDDKKGFTSLGFVVVGFWMDLFASRGSGVSLLSFHSDAVEGEQ